MASVSSSTVDGLISGLDTSAIISKLLTADAAPQTQLKTSVSAAQLKVTAYQSVNTKMSALQTAADNLSNAATWASAKATSSSDSLVATANSTAQPGSVTLNVQNLASGRSVVSRNAYSASDTTAAQNLGYPLDVVANGQIVGTISPSVGTLADVAAAINKATGLGITAVAVRVGDDQYRLQITSTKTGAKDGDFKLVSRNSDGTSAGVGGADSSKYQSVSFAADAQAYLVGSLDSSDQSVPVTSSTNTFQNVLNGVNVTATKTGAATVTVGTDPSAVADAVGALVKAANAAVSEIATQSRPGAVGSDGKVVGGGTLRGDAVLRQLKMSILGAVTSAIGTNVSPAQFGIQSTKDGELTFDKGKFLDSYGKDPVAAQRLLAPKSLDSTSTATGLVDRLSSLAKGATDQYTGQLTTAITGQNTTISDLTKRIADWDDRLADRKVRYQKYYSSLETSLGKLQNQSTWLSGQLSKLG